MQYVIQTYNDAYIFNHFLQFLRNIKKKNLKRIIVLIVQNVR